MKVPHRHFAAAAIFACFAINAPVYAQTAQQLSPVYVDAHHGFLYFLVKNNGHRTINNLFGWVYGSGSPARRGVYIVNNPHAEGMKVSLGSHMPGAVALYRFMVSPDDMDFESYRLMIDNDGLRYPLRRVQF